MKIKFRQFLLTLFILMIFICTFSSCYNIFENYYPEEECLVRSGIDGEYQVYSDKVYLWISLDNDKASNDRVSVKIFDDYKYEILSDDFIKYAWNDFVLYIKTKDFYYSFNIKEYEVPNQATLPTNKKGEIKYKKIIPEYNLEKYTYEEFREKYPEYKDFEWYNGS